jgi:archaellum biogenesis protein FlaJ (TadC family)
VTGTDGGGGRPRERGDRPPRSDADHRPYSSSDRRESGERRLCTDGGTAERSEAVNAAHAETAIEEAEAATHGVGLSLLDRALYALFSRHADSGRHDTDRAIYRGTDVTTSFGVYVARLYGLSWVVLAVAVALATVAVAALLPDQIAATQKALPTGSRGIAAIVLALPVGAVAKRGSIRLGGRYLKLRAAARASNIERTLPGAVRYLRVLSTGSDDLRGMLGKVARNEEAYGHTSVAFRTALNKATLTGSLGEGLRIVARDTPSRDTLAPFLLKFREHASQGQEELTSYLRMEARMLSHRQSRARERRQDFLELLAELFIVLLVLPALLVIVISVLSVLSTGLSGSIVTPFGTITLRALVIYGSAVLVLLVGLGAAMAVETLRPPGQTRRYRRPETVAETVVTATTNPASAIVFAIPGAVAVGVLLYASGLPPLNALLLAYAAWTIPVGAVSVRRSRIDDAKDREIKDFVHAVSGHVALGRPFSEAVAVVAREIDLGPLDPDVADLAFNSRLTTHDGDLRSEALDRFVERVGTPLAEQTIGLVTGALDSGGDVEDVFDALQTEVGRLHHEKQALRSSMQVYVAVGWTTALLIVGITIAVNGYVIDGFTQLSAVSEADGSIGFDPGAVDLDAMRFRFYVVSQCTLLACGWFAGVANRGRYEGLLHSGLLVLLGYLIFRGVGMA